jgi:NAD(P)H-hydrate epimerase
MGGPTRRLTREQIREVDRQAIEVFGIPGVVLMENAGRAAAKIAVAMLPEREGRSVLIACGTGNNGGDGWVMARHLMNAGVSVRACLCGSENRLSADAALFHAVARKMGLVVMPALSTEDVENVSSVCKGSDLLVAALLGTGFQGEVRSPMAELIGRMNGVEAPILAVDVPSGLDCDTGQGANATIRARATVTFVAEKAGFGQREAREYLGEVHVADIGVPRGIMEAI